MRPIVHGFKPYFKSSTVPRPAVDNGINRQLAMSGRHVIDAIARCLDPSDASRTIQYWNVESHDNINNNWIVVRNDYDSSIPEWEKQRIRFFAVEYQSTDATDIDRTVRGVAFQHYAKLPPPFSSINGSNGLLPDGTLNPWTSPIIRLGSNNPNYGMNSRRDDENSIFINDRSGYFFSRLFNSTVSGLNPYRHSFIIEHEDALVFLLTRSGGATPIPTHWTQPNHNAYLYTGMIGKIFAPYDDGLSGYGIVSDLIQINQNNPSGYAFPTRNTNGNSDVSTYNYNASQIQTIAYIDHDDSWGNIVLKGWWAKRPDGTVFRDVTNDDIIKQVLPDRFAPINICYFGSRNGVEVSTGGPRLGYHKYAAMSPFHPFSQDTTETKVPGSILGASGKARWILAATMCRGALSDSGQADGLLWGTNIVFSWAKSDSDVRYFNITDDP